MGTRVGIELSPVACRIVELEGLDIQPGRPPETRVRSYSVLPRSGPETEQRFASIGRLPVAVVVWGARRDHRRVVVSKGSYEKMRAEALAAARAMGVDTAGTIADIATASTAIKGASRQPVVLALANASDVSAAVRPLVEAHVRIRSVITPADALLGLARSRQAFAVPGGIEAYVALDATVTCVALIRDGSLLSARELPWGYEDGVATTAVPEDPEGFARREDLASRLLNELAGFLAAIGEEGNVVAQISVCGGLPDLRTMTVPLMERLDIEVEALDSLFGIDADRLPEPSIEFRERAAELRLAWAAAADWRGPINLMRYRRRRDTRVVLARAAVVAGVAAGLGAGWVIQQSQWWQSTASEPTIADRTPPIAPPGSSAPARANAAPRPQLPPVAVTQPRGTTPTAPTTTVAPPVVRSPSPAAPASAVTLSSGSRGSAPPAPAVASTAASSAAPKPLVTSAPTVTPPPEAARGPAAVPQIARGTPPAIPVPRARPMLTAPGQPLPAAVTRPTPVAPVVTRPAPPVEPPASPARPPASTPSAGTVAPVTAAIPAAPPAVRTPVAREEPARAPAPVAIPTATRRPAEPPPVPFDAVLGTILYSPDRRLAIVNGRIVGPGDEVNGARIVDITQTTVLLRDGQGRLRSLTLGAAGRPPAAAQ